MKQFVACLVEGSTAQYQYLQVHPQAWIKMTPEQKCALVNQFGDTSLRRSMSASYEDTASNESNAMSKSNMSVTSEHCGITSLPQATLNSIPAQTSSDCHTLNDWIENGTSPFMNDTVVVLLPVLSNVLIPADLQPLLTSVHKEYLHFDVLCSSYWQVVVIIVFPVQ